ncbi:MAG: helix-turn-helix transcriptional regulator [Clostridia bacterium]|nr:helix-turn-helix transcriptional regulator [Clostridia bacterium]
MKLRKLKGLTQDELASAIGVSRQAVYKWESGQSYPEVPKLIEMKLIFGISIDDLLDENYEVVLPEKKKRKRLSGEEKKAIEAKVEAEEAPAEAVVEAAPAEEAPAEAVVEAAPAEEAPAEAVVEAAPAEEAPAEAVVEEAPAEEAPAEAVVEEAPAEAVVEAAPAEAADEPAKKKGFFARLFGNK